VGCVRCCVDQTGADDVLDQVLVVEGAHLPDNEAHGEEQGAKDIEAGQAPTLVVSGRCQFCLDCIYQPRYIWEAWVGLGKWVYVTYMQ
jgi:hypothetical protein